MYINAKADRSLFLLSQVLNWDLECNGFQEWKIEGSKITLRCLDWKCRASAICNTWRILLSNIKDVIEPPKLLTRAGDMHLCAEPTRSQPTPPVFLFPFLTFPHVFIWYDANIIFFFFFSFTWWFLWNFNFTLHGWHDVKRLPHDYRAQRHLW